MGTVQPACLLRIRGAIHCVTRNSPQTKTPTTRVGVLVGFYCRWKHICAAGGSITVPDSTYTAISKRFSYNRRGPFLANKLNRIPKTIPRRSCCGPVNSVRGCITSQAHFLQKSSAIQHEKHE